jgi:hypothetical protein
MSGEAGYERGKAAPQSAPEASGRHMSELEGRGVAWTEERGTSDEGRRRLEAAWRRAGDGA